MRCENKMTNGEIRLGLSLWTEERDVEDWGGVESETSRLEDVKGDKKTRVRE